jgi:hypothetical protein
LSCETNADRAAQATGANGIAAAKSGYVAGKTPEAAGCLARANEGLWPPPTGANRLWRDYRVAIKTALKQWRSRKDDRMLGRMRMELAGTLARQAEKTKENEGPAGAATELALERARLLVAPPKSMTVGERVERVAVLDNALALMRLGGVIDEKQYRSALVDAVCRQRAVSQRSTAPVTWQPVCPVGMEEETASQVDPTRKIRTRYRVVELADVVASNTLSGVINPAYDALLQPRRRERAASRAQIERMARTLDANALLKSGANWSDGAPLVGPDGMVESGNGRVLALRRAVEINVEGYETYRGQLLARAEQLGLDRYQVAKLKQPVLVRERLTKMSQDERQRFVNEANASSVERMGVAEQARADAGRIFPGFFQDLQVAGSDRSLGDVLRKKRNAGVVARFFKLLPKTERATLMDEKGNLSAEGINRLERAMFAYAMPGSSGERLARLVFEEGEAIDRVGAGLRQALPQLGRMEDMIQAGQRDKSLSIGDDLAAAVEKMRDIRRQGLSVNDYLRQTRLFDELSPLQEQLLAQLDSRRHSGRAVAGLINAYAEAALKTAPPNQGRMFGEQVNREQLFKSALKKVRGTWVDVRTWSAAQRAISGRNVPATQVQQFSLAQQARGMQNAGKSV